MCHYTPAVLCVYRPGSRHNVRYISVGDPLVACEVLELLLLRHIDNDFVGEEGT